MTKPWVLISPSSRGIGFSLTKHLLSTTSLPILSTARSNASAVHDSLLQDLPKAKSQQLTVLSLDVNSEDLVQNASQQAHALFPPETHHLHLGVALPGILHPEKSPAQVSYEDALEMLRTNALGPLMLMKHFGEFLPRKRSSRSSSDEGGRNDDNGEGDGKVQLPDHATWLTLSARVGSISDNRLGGWYSYRASKAAVNSLTKTFDLYLQQRSGDRAMAIAYHPGTVKTGLSKEFWNNVKEDKLFSPEFAVEKLVEVLCNRGLADRGRIWDWKGEEILP